MGTQVESQSREWKNRYKRSIGAIGKSVAQQEDVMWTELKVGKLVSELSRKAAIVLYKPVP